MIIHYNNINRINAIKWWNNTDMLIKAMLVTRYYANRQISSLTGREIENLYLKSK